MHKGDKNNSESGFAETLENCIQTNIRDLSSILGRMSNETKNNIPQEKWLDLCKLVVKQNIIYLADFLEMIPDEKKNEIPHEEWLELLESAINKDIKYLPALLKTMPNEKKNEIPQKKWLEWCELVVNENIEYPVFLVGNLGSLLKMMPNEAKNNIPQEKWLEWCKLVVNKNIVYLPDLLNNIPYDKLLSNEIQGIIAENKSAVNALCIFAALTDKSDIEDQMNHLDLMYKSGYNTESETSKKEQFLTLLKKAMSNNLFLLTLSGQNVSQINLIIDAIGTDIGILTMKYSRYKESMQDRYEESMQDLYALGIDLEKLLIIHADKHVDKTPIEPNIVIKDKNNKDVKIGTISDFLFVYQLAHNLLTNKNLPDSCIQKLTDKYKPFFASDDNNDNKCITHEMSTLLKNNSINLNHYGDIKNILSLYEKIPQKNPTFVGKNTEDIEKIINNKMAPGSFSYRQTEYIETKLLNNVENIKLLMEISKYHDDTELESIITTAIHASISSKDCGANIGVLLDNQLKKDQFDGNVGASAFHSFISNLVIGDIFNSKREAIEGDGHINNKNIKKDQYYVNMHDLLYNIGLKVKPVPSVRDRHYCQVSDDLYSPHIRIGAEALLGMLEQEGRDLDIYPELQGIVKQINDKIARGSGPSRPGSSVRVM